MKSKVSVLILNYVFVFVSIFVFQACAQTQEDKQKYVDGYFKIIEEIKSRRDLIKKGADAIVAYRKSEFMDISAAEQAKMALLEGIALDSIALEHLDDLDTPDELTEDISMDLKRGIDAVTEANRLFASNYEMAKTQTPEQRKETMLNVKPGLFKMAQGVNAVVVSMTKLEKYITQNELQGKKELLLWFRQFNMERENLKSFLKE